MRYAVLADVHASIEALDAVLADARGARVDRIVCAGDLVGYHADPEACVARVVDLGVTCVAGNHDRVAAGIADPHDFGEIARRASLWTRDRISPASRAFLASLPTCRVVDDRFLLVHAALSPEPSTELHLSRASRVRRSIEALGTGRFGVRVGFFGHTHRAAFHALEGGSVASIEVASFEHEPVSLARARAHLVNPGSVGQPRDGDPRAAYAIFDADRRSILFRRVPFDHDACRAKAARAGLLDEPRRGAIARLVEMTRRLA